METITTVVVVVILAALGFSSFGQKLNSYSVNTKPATSEVQTNITSITETRNIENENVDKFGIKKLYPDLLNGRQWLSNWNNGEVRSLKSGQRDSFDSEFVARGSGTIYLSGNGTASISGNSPRMYVYDKNEKLKWGNVEVTVYARRISETGNFSSQGIVIGARSEHQDADEANPCLGRTYYGRILYDGRAVFQKEVIHEGAYSLNMPSEKNKAMWNTPDDTLPRNVWIGMKFVVKTNPDGKSVKMELYRDLADGKDGGTWEKLAEYTDSGSWWQTDSGADVVAKCGYFPGMVLFEPGTSVFIRNDYVGETRYKKFSIREIL